MVYTAPVLLDQYVQYANRMTEPKRIYSQITKVSHIPAGFVYRELEEKEKKLIRNETRKRHPNSFYSEAGKGRLFQEFV